MPHFTASTCGVQPSDDCSDAEYRLTHLGECPDDTRCSDPDFAAANPGLCLNAPRLFIKPSAAVAQVLGEVQYAAFLFANGVETELTDGVTWSVADSSIALIGASSGNATGVAVGITTITATYGGMTSTARLEVIASCASRANHFLFLFDVSRSMGAEFSAVEGTRLEVAQAIAEDFINNTNFAKDNGAVMSFDTTTAAVQAFTTNDALLVAASNGLTPTALHTDLNTALTDAVAYFTSQAVPSSGRVIVLFTDGENNTGDNPITIADTLKAAGTILMVIGVRAKGNAFALLNKIASGGFFINVLPSNLSSASDWVDGLRQYLCSQNCVPEGDETLGVGQLNFTGFTKWDVIANHVDLIGKNEGGTPLFNFLPGNGLYVDGCGSTVGVSGGDKGTIRTKSRFVWNSTKTYSITARIAGNQRLAGTDVTTIKVYDKNDVLMASKVCSVTNYKQDFTDYTLTFNPNASQSGGLGGRIEIEQTSLASIPAGVVGNLWDRVTLRNVTDDIVLFDDNFDEENPTYINPACGYAYCYGQACLDEAIPAQTPDPNPIPCREGDSNPVAYTSTRSATACCADDPSTCSTQSASATSYISQSDADTKAYSAALEAAQDALVCLYDFDVGGIVSIDFVEFERSPGKTGYAAIGLTGDDFWNQVITSVSGTDGGIMLDSEGRDLGVSLTCPSHGFKHSSHPDILMKQGHQDTDSTYKIYGLPTGSFDLYLYGHGDANNENTVFSVSNGVTTFGPESTVNGTGWETNTWVEGMQFVKIPITVTAGQTVQITVGDGASGGHFINGLQIKRTA